MNHPLLKLPYENALICSQGCMSEKGRSHYKKYANTRCALDFTLNGESPFHVLASADGIAKVWNCCNHKSGNCKCGLGFGNQMRIYHDGYLTFYSHLSKIFVKDGRFVKQGEIIGIAGRSGLAGDVHLHWTFGKESKESKSVEEKFIPFWSIEAEKIEIEEHKRKKIVSNTYFKTGMKYLSTNKATR